MCCVRSFLCSGSGMSTGSTHQTTGSACVAFRPLRCEAPEPAGMTGDRAAGPEPDRAGGVVSRAVSVCPGPAEARQGQAGGRKCLPTPGLRPREGPQGCVRRKGLCTLPAQQSSGQPRGRVWARRLDKQKQTWKEATAGRRRAQESMRVLAAGTGPEQSEGQNQAGCYQPNRRRLRLGKRPTAWSDPPQVTNRPPRTRGREPRLPGSGVLRCKRIPADNTGR